jgi:hypothetical protein
VAGCAAAVMAGCATTGYNQAGKMAANMQQTRQDVLDARSQVTVTINALEAVSRVQVGDPRPVLATFSKELARLDKAAESARWRAQNIRESGATYFASWAEEIEAMQNPGIRANSLKRREQTIASYREVEKSLMALKDAYLPLVAGLRDIEKALLADLTKSGIAAVQPAQKAMRQKAVELQTLMTQSLGVIDRVVADLNTGGTM